MALFFIDRPVFAWVIALFIIIGGALAITQLPVSQYPSIAPPSISITATYPGASAQTLDDSVTSLICQELNGAEGLKYVEATSEANGTTQITATFILGTDPDLAQVEVQNRLKRVESRLPRAVTQQGVQVAKSNSNILLFATLSSSDGRLSALELGDYISRNVIDPLKRVPGVGQVQLFGSEIAMRVWINPDKLVGYGLTTNDVIAAISAQNVTVAAGSFGAYPSTKSQQITQPVVVEGQLGSVEEFGAIILRSGTGGDNLRLRDVARVEIGAQSYSTSARLDGKPTAALGVQLSPSANALATANAVKAELSTLSKQFPSGVSYSVPYDTSLFVQISIEEVIKTLIEAVILVFLVMYLFLQNLRATLIPTIVVPVALMGAFLAMSAFGFSINVLTLFGLVLAIGILVDDAIVVVENVERIMSTEGLSPREATRKAMGQISSAIIGITLVLTAVFIPMAFFPGSVGAIYRQFSLSLVATMLFSALMALTLTPALCATMLKPVLAGHHHTRGGFFGWFNRFVDSGTKRYEGWIARIIRCCGRWMLLYAGILVVVGFLYMRLPSSFLPSEDQGYIITNIQLPPAASINRTQEVVEQVEDYFLEQPAVAHIIAVTGFSFSGRGENAGIAFVPLKDWDERTDPNDAASSIAGEAFMALSNIKDAFIFALNPPPIRELGNATGFSFRLQDRAGLGHAALMAAQGQLLDLANTPGSGLVGVRPEGLADAPQLELKIDRERAAALGVTYFDIASTLQAALGSAYVNDFPSNGRQQRVIVQAQAEARLGPDDLKRIFVRNSSGEMVPLSNLITAKWATGPVQVSRYNGFPAVKISGSAAPGRSSGEAMATMVGFMAQLPPGLGYEWTGQSLEEQSSGDLAPALYTLSLLAVFLCLAALYESWSVPAAVMLVVPLGILGSLAAMVLRDLPNDVYFKVGLIAIIGLSAKNAILIIEFAKDLRDQGKSLIESILEAVRLRFRPIIMTSMAFMLGVLPLVLADGAGSASQRAIGTAVLGGMITATVLAVFLVPVFFIVINRLLVRSPKAQLETRDDNNAPAIAEK